MRRIRRDRPYRVVRLRPDAARCTSRSRSRVRVTICSRV